MKKILKVTSIAAAMSMALSFGVVASAAEETEDIPVPQSSKTVKANDDGTYDVALSFEGSVKTETSTKFTTSDVVIIADKSGSMSGSSWTSLKDAVSVLVEKVLPEGTNNQAALITFSSSSNVQSFGEEKYWTSSADDINSALETIEPYGSTYCADPIEDATDLLANTRNDSAKYVIFMSDGYPFDEDESLAAAENLRLAYPDATFYTVGVVGCDADFMKALAKTEENYFFAENSDELASIFDGIATVITKSYSNVVISDTLSDYAEYVEYDENGKPIFNVEVRDADGNVVDETAYTVNYNEETKTVSLELGSEEVPDKWTYTLSYKVKPNAYADEYYAKNGYDAVGDENTDAEGNATSSGKDGFKISTGKMEFTYRDVNYVAEFVEPVFQVQVKDEPSKDEPSKDEPSKDEPSKAPTPSKPEGKPANNVPQTGSTQNIAVILAILAVSALGIVSVKMLGTKKSK